MCIIKVILFKEFLNVANEENFTILGGKLKLFQTFTTRSLKLIRVFVRKVDPRVRAAVVYSRPIFKCFSPSVSPVNLQQSIY